MLIREEQQTDFMDIFELVRDAFETAPVSDGNEHYFVNRLRASRGYVPEFALVAESYGTLIGHIMLTELPVEAKNEIYTELLLAPLCVMYEYRGHGVGSALVTEALRQARQHGYGAVFLAGDPGYYGRFGFRQSTEFGIKNINGIPDEYVLACELEQGALYGKAGIVDLEPV